MLNALPQEVSGIQHPLPLSGAESFTAAAVEKLGFGMADIVSFYYFVLLSEQMSKLDAVAKRMVDAITLLSTDMSTKPDDMQSHLVGTGQSLSLLVNSQAGKVKQGFLHPVQDVVRSVGKKVLNVLNMFNSSHLDYKELLDSKLAAVLNFSLEKKAAYSSRSESPFGDRRVLEKVFRLLGKAAKEGGSRTISYTGSIQGVSHLWLVKATIGGGLVVVPHVPKIELISGGSKVRINALKKSAGFGAFMTETTKLTPNK